MSTKCEMQNIEQFIVIDDDPLSTYICKLIIERFFDKTSIVTYNHSQKALDYFLKIFKDYPVATIVMLDINMPELSGWDVLDLLSTLDEDVLKNVTVIMLSSSIDLKDKQQAISHPLVIGYLEKPLTPVKLEQVMALMKNTTTV